MGEQRIKGQDVEVMLVQDGQALTTITDVRSMEMAVQLEILKEGYLGETTDRRDEVFRGVRGNIEFHYENQDVFSLIAAIVDRARRRTPGTQVNVKATLNFPNGQRVRSIIPNVFFGEIPLAFGGRAEYGTMRLEWEAETYRAIA